LLLLSCAGISSKFFKNFISQVKVNEDIVMELLSRSQIDSDVAPMNGQLVKCGEDSTYHLQCFTKFSSTCCDRQVTQMCQAIASIADGVEELAGIECADEFVALAYDSKGLPFVTSSLTEIQALKIEYAKAEAAEAKKADNRKQKNAALLANRTEDEIEQEEQKNNRTEDEIEQEEQKKNEARLAANERRRARYASLTEDEKNEARLAANERRANRTEDEKEKARLAKNASQNERLANRTEDEKEKARLKLNERRRLR